MANVEDYKCSEHGRCDVKEIAMGAATKKTCIATSTEDCQRSQACQKHGLCLAVAGSCR